MITDYEVDYCYGCRVKLGAGDWRVTMKKGPVTEHVFDKTGPGEVVSPERYYIPWVVTVEKDGEKHVTSYDATGQRIAFWFSMGLGDVISQMRAVLNFTEKTACLPTCVIPIRYSVLFRHPAYARFKFMTEDSAVHAPLPWYALYHMPIIMGTGWECCMPFDPSKIGMIDMAADVLGVRRDQRPPPITLVL